MGLFTRTQKVRPDAVRIGDKIHCSDGRFREVDVLDYARRADGIYRFGFTDDRWIQYREDEMATIKVRRSKG